MFTDFLDAWNTPSMRHAMVIHFPIVLSIIGVPFAVLAAAVNAKGRTLRWIALALYLSLTVAALVARYSGQDAQDAIRGSLDEEAEEAIEEHEAHGLNLWRWPAGISVLIGASFVGNRRVRLGTAWLAVAGAALAAERIAHTADHGGRLVYEHGAGTPDQIAELFAAAQSTGDPTDDPRLVFFRDEVRPILATHCLRCHNPKRAKRSGGLDQTTIAGLLSGGRSGPAIVPGKPAESLLIKAVRWEDPDLEMPLGEEQLPQDLTAALERWIAEGAVWEPFDFVPPGSSQ